MDGLYILAAEEFAAKKRKLWLKSSFKLFSPYFTEKRLIFFFCKVFCETTTLCEVKKCQWSTPISKGKKFGHYFLEGRIPYARKSFFRVRESFEGNHLKPNKILTISYPGPKIIWEVAKPGAITMKWEERKKTRKRRREKLRILIRTEFTGNQHE